MQHFNFGWSYATPTFPPQMHRHSTPGDRRTGLSAAQAASAAALNITQGNLSDPRIAAIAVNFIEAFHGAKPNRLAGHIAAIRRRIHREYFEANNNPPPRPRDGVGHIAIVEHLLSPSANDLVLETIETHLAGTFAYTHAHALDRLRQRSRCAHDDAYERFMQNDLGLVLQIAKDGGFPAHPLDELVKSVRHHARCLAIRAAHDLVDILRTHSLAPHGDRFAGFHDWKLVGHSVLSTIASPAQVLQRFVRNASTGRYAAVEEEDLHTHLQADAILPGDESGRRVIRIAHIVKAALDRRGSYDTMRAARHVARSCRKAARLTQGDMKSAGLAHQDFAEFRIGLSSSEASAYVALQLLKALNRIDACVSAIMEGRPLPPCTETAPPRKSAAYATTILRAETRPDKNAPMVGHVGGGLVRDLDKDRGCSRMPLDAALLKLRDPEIARRAQDAIGIDPTVWFMN
ncbi:hypothetical protein [Sphingomonas oligoaromativorans]|uniref:hypothetical protein n=1 Tax=Sphingomonas oligoaromativorans TaxID=575322 RepID=UPI0014220268|nr:hypothetical protein [Sphingomonas oligoaromativorans]NIJ35294.1 hypothetical protein [Sphingomonas oligoaromativorans]